MCRSLDLRPFSLLFKAKGLLQALESTLGLRQGLRHQGRALFPTFHPPSTYLRSPFWVEHDLKRSRRGAVHGVAQGHLHHILRVTLQPVVQWDLRTPQTRLNQTFGPSKALPVEHFGLIEPAFDRLGKQLLDSDPRL